MQILFATDHAGFELKEQLAPYVRDELGYAISDHGAHSYDENDDYPDYIASAACVVSQAPAACRAIILGGSGQGEAMVANRHAHVRTAVYYGGDLSIVRLAREHNDANVLSLGARFLTVERAKEAVQLWLETPFSEKERHARRIQKIEDVSDAAQ